jgi:F-type H+-transporting ATPase subunit delta
VRDPTIARNYAEALFELGERLDQTERFADLMAALSTAILSDRAIRIAIESPRVPKNVKQRMLEKALQDFAPPQFVRFLGAVIKRSRQELLPLINSEYSVLVDEKFNRLRAGVTLAREPDEALRETVRAKLSEVTGKEVIPHFRTDPAILGGLILRLGDRIVDGSLRRRMMTLKRQLLAG